MTALTQRTSGRIGVLLFAVIAIAALLFTALLPAGANEIDPVEVRNTGPDTCRTLGFAVDDFDFHCSFALYPCQGTGAERSTA